MKTNLTVDRIRSFKCPSGRTQAFLYDSSVPGLGVRALPGGKQSWIFEARVRGRNVRRTIGDLRAWSLPAAREEARRLRRLIDVGQDPRKERAVRHKGESFGALWKAYLAAHQKTWGARHMADAIWLARAPEDRKESNRKLSEYGGPLFPLLKKPIADFSTEGLITWARKVLDRSSESETNKAKHTALRQSFERLRAAWTWAMERPEWAAELPEVNFKHSDLRDLIPKSGAKKDDVLEKSQLADWFAAVRSVDNPVISAYLQALLLVGCRRGELADLKWKDVSFKWNRLHLRDKIDPDGRTVPMSPFVARLIDGLPRRSEFVFSSASSESGKLVEPRIAHTRACREAGIQVSLHGLRRSFATLSEWIEMPAGICAQLQGHAPGAVQERHYKKRPLDLLAIWQNKFEGWILEQAGIPFDPAATTKRGLRSVK